MGCFSVRVRPSSAGSFLRFFDRMSTECRHSIEESNSIRPLAAGILRRLEGKRHQQTSCDGRGGRPSFTRYGARSAIRLVTMPLNILSVLSPERSVAPRALGTPRVNHVLLGCPFLGSELLLWVFILFIFLGALWARRRLVSPWVTVPIAGANYVRLG